MSQSSSSSFFNNTIVATERLTLPTGKNLTNATSRTLVPTKGSMAYDSNLDLLYYGDTNQWLQVGTGTQGSTGPTGMGSIGSTGPTGISSVTSNPSWLVPDWYVAPITGSDSNDGASPLTPVKTIMGGIVSRWGTRSPILDQNTIIHLLEPETIGQEAVVLSPIIINGVSFSIIGTNITLSTTTISSLVTALNPTLGTNLTFTIPSVLGLSNGNLIYNITRGSYAIIDDITGFVITATQPFDQAGLTTVSTIPSLVLDNSWNTGDSIQFEESPLLNLKIINPQGGDAFNPVCWLQNIFIPSIGGVGFSQITPIAQACSFVMSNCRLDVFVTLDSQLIYFVGQFQNTWLNGGCYLGPFSTIMGGSSNKAGVNYYGFFGGNADGNAMLHGAATACPVVSPGARFGQVNLIGSPLFINAGATLQIFGSYIGPSRVWGTAQLRVTQNNAAVVNAGLGASVTWVSCLDLPSGLSINGSNLAYAFNTGTATFNPVLVSITPANLDAFIGLQNPLTGSRFAGPWPE